MHWCSITSRYRKRLFTHAQVQASLKYVVSTYLHVPVSQTCALIVLEESDLSRAPKAESVCQLQALIIF